MTMCAALLLAGCAAPSAVDGHWGEAQRGASQAMVEAARSERAGRGIDGEGASAAYDNYSDALRAEPEPAPKVLLDIVRGND
jgi:hypothetical protein